MDGLWSLLYSFLDDEIGNLLQYDRKQSIQIKKATDRHQQKKQNQFGYFNQPVASEMFQQIMHAYKSSTSDLYRRHCCITYRPLTITGAKKLNHIEEANRCNMWPWILFIDMQWPNSACPAWQIKT